MKFKKKKKKKKKNDNCKKRIKYNFFTKKKQECNKVVIKKVPKTSVEHIKGNEKFYFYLYLLGI
jgi:hypothetical protein